LAQGSQLVSPVAVMAAPRSGEWRQRSVAALAATRPSDVATATSCATNAEGGLWHKWCRHRAEHDAAELVLPRATQQGGIMREKC